MALHYFQESGIMFGDHHCIASSPSHCQNKNTTSQSTFDVYNRTIPFEDCMFLHGLEFKHLPCYVPTFLYLTSDIKTHISLQVS